MKLTKRKGFTLMELLVVMAVSMILIASLVTMIASISSFRAARDEERRVDDELLAVETRISDWFSQFDVSGTANPMLQGGGHRLVFGGQSASHSGTTLYVGAEEYPTEYIREIVFDTDVANPGLVKCTVSYELLDEDGVEITSGDYVFMMIKRSQS